MVIDKLNEELYVSERDDKMVLSAKIVVLLAILAIIAVIIF